MKQEKPLLWYSKSKYPMYNVSIRLCELCDVEYVWTFSWTRSHSPSSRLSHLTFHFPLTAGWCEGLEDDIQVKANIPCPARGAEEWCAGAGPAWVIDPSGLLLVFLPQDHLANLLTCSLIGWSWPLLPSHWSVLAPSGSQDKCFPLRMSSPAPASQHQPGIGGGWAVAGPRLVLQKVPSEGS